MSYESQNLLSVYPQLANTRRLPARQPRFARQRRSRSCISSCISCPRRSASCNVIVAAVDRLQGATPVPPPPARRPVRRNSPRRAPEDWSHSDGRRVDGRCAGRLRAARHLYQVPPVRWPSPFDLPVGTATSIAVPPTLPGSFTVRVVAVNAAGESPASNTVTFTVPPVQ